MTKTRRLTLLLIAASASPSIYAASDAPGTLSVVLENDWFNGSDSHYTNGFSVGWVPGAAAPPPQWAVNLARLLPWFPQQGEVRHGYAFGQSTFVPSDITVADPPLTDRPYAGWLYASLGLAADSGSTLDQFGVTVGVVGPASFAEDTQKFFHEALGSDDPQGWDTQLENEPGVVLTYQRSWRGPATGGASGPQFDFVPHAGAALGNVYTYANAGVTLRYGTQLPNDYGAPYVRQGLPAASNFTTASDFGWYVFAGVEGRAVAHNIFLDGNTFRDSRSVDKKPFVGDLQFGFVLDWPDVRVSYTHVLRTREFRTQEDNDGYGAVSVALKF